jgi:hypothetical protein
VGVLTTFANHGLGVKYVVCSIGMDIEVHSHGTVPDPGLDLRTLGRRREGFSDSLSEGMARGVWSSRASA